ncbi:MAG: 2-dehydro-3-deoxygalactonokinase, partial [Ginsengibacter sp.]
MMELPYKEVPFSIDGHDLVLKTIKGNEDFRHPIFMISGVRTANDVMRGEETQLTGCLHSDDEEDQIFIFPGTHSKHVKVNNGRAVDFATYMTGEFFELLSQKSILSNNVEADNNLLSTNLKSFETGVTDSSDSHILHTAFLVRTNQLFGKFSKPENYNYLSGLLIGTELQQLIKKDIPLTLVSSKKLEQSYSAALSILGLKFKVQNSEEALIRGQYRILEYNK